VIERELERYLPFLATTKVLMAAVQKGVGRETAHEAIKEHATTVALSMREQGVTHNDLFARLADDARLKLSAAELSALLAEPLSFVGAARQQVQRFVQQVEALARAHPDAATYQPDTML
jgi:adenylosuccinate lyase